MPGRTVTFLIKSIQWIAILLTAGCAADSVTSVLPIAGSVLEPDRIVVKDFQVTPEAAALGGVEGDNTLETAEDVRVGATLAAALSRYLVDELRGYGIDADHAGKAAPPGVATISITGRFMRVEKGTASNLVGGFRLVDKVRTRIMIFQGTSTNLQFIAQGDTATATGLRVGMTADNETTVMKTDAHRAAKDVAARVADYYRNRGWLK
jgi:hypothetical protein